MKSILLLARICFLYNICLLLTIVLRYYDFISDISTKSTVIVAGYLLSLIANFALLVIVLVMLAMGRSLKELRPQWLFVANAVIFIIQLFFLVR
jgi:hypothetical protein